jgi:hypothetical protein
MQAAWSRRPESHSIRRFRRQHCGHGGADYGVELVHAQSGVLSRFDRASDRYLERPSWSLIFPRAPSDPQVLPVLVLSPQSAKLIGNSTNQVESNLRPDFSNDSPTLLTKQSRERSVRVNSKPKMPVIRKDFRHSFAFDNAFGLVANLHGH